MFSIERLEKKNIYIYTQFYFLIYIQYKMKRKFSLKMMMMIIKLLQSEMIILEIEKKYSYCMSSGQQLFGTEIN